MPTATQINRMREQLASPDLDEVKQVLFELAPPQGKIPRKQQKVLYATVGHHLAYYDSSGAESECRVRIDPVIEEYPHAGFIALYTFLTRPIERGPCGGLVSMRDGYNFAFRGKGLTELPPNILELKDRVTALSFDQNRLTELPESLLQMRCTVSVAGNPIRVMPEKLKVEGDPDMWEYYYERQYFEDYLGLEFSEED